METLTNSKIQAIVSIDNYLSKSMTHIKIDYWIKRLPLFLDCVGY